MATLRPLSAAYGAAVAARNHLYDRGFLKAKRLPCPVISVGNITAGGTGKTPTVILLAELLKAAGRRPAVLSRGYGGSARGQVNVVSDGARTLLSWTEAGDEPVLIARRTEAVPVLVGPRRAPLGYAALDRFGADCLILDDGFQHRSLARDMDIVLVEAARPFGNGRLLPAGPLREPPAALARADLVVAVGKGEPPPEYFAGRRLLRAARRPLDLTEAVTGRTLPLSSLAGKRVLAFAGIGSPGPFFRGLSELGAELVCGLAFADHHPYCRADLQALSAKAGEKAAELIVTTEKDWIRLEGLPDLPAGLAVLRIAMEVRPEDEFAAAVLSGLGR